ncbi:hypothetical protein BaRGS_00030796, partial [Batillaria attramentaria]
QQEQDPTNLYIANLPMHFTEKHLENMFHEYGTVISTRILRKPDGFSRCVGFARMESKDKCEQIINAFNSKLISGCTEPLLVKFADSGNKKKNQQQKMFMGRDDALQLPYEQHAALAANLNAMATPTLLPTGILPRYSSVATTPVTTYQVSSNPGWMPQYIMQPQMPHNLDVAEMVVHARTKSHSVRNQWTILSLFSFQTNACMIDASVLAVCTFETQTENRKPTHMQMVYVTGTRDSSLGAPRRVCRCFGSRNCPDVTSPLPTLAHPHPAILSGISTGSCLALSPIAPPQGK